MLDEVRRWGEEAAKAADASLWALTDHELLDSLRAVHQVQQVLGVLQLRLVREAAGRDLPGHERYRSVASWLGGTLRIDPGPARQIAKTAVALRSRPAVERAVIDGELDMRQAAVIAATVNALPETLSAVDPAAEDVTAEAEVALIEMAGQLPAYQLRKAGDRILAHIAPDIADRADEEALRRAEARAHRRRHLTLSPPQDGIVRISGRLSVEDAATIRAALDPLCHPIPGDQRNAPQRRADALVDVCRIALRTGDLPADGGEPAQLSVTIGFDPLRARLGKGLLPDGDRVSAATARRMACDARILPFVLGGASQVLDAGRSRRLAHGPLRRALTVRDRGCAFPGCDRPARWCDAHHIVCWTDGGSTDLDNLVLLCRHHHRLIHDPAGGWQISLDAHRHPVFTPPPWADPQQRPSRNRYHLRT